MKISSLGSISRYLLCCLALVVATIYFTPAYADWLGTLGGTGSIAYGVSSDGSTVVGNSTFAGDTATHAFLWKGGKMTDLGTLGGASSYGYGVSGDGSTAVGFSYVSNNVDYHAFRWKGGKMTDLGTLGGTFSEAFGASSDGSTVVGYAATNIGVVHAFRWSGGTMTDLGTLSGMNSFARGVSGDGSTVVGYASITGETANHAFRWNGGTMTDLGTLGGSNSYAYGVSGDGSTVVGNSQTVVAISTYHAFRWNGGTMVDLGTLGGALSSADAISGDGSTVVGFAETSSASTAFRWTQAGGMQSVNSWLAAAHVIVPKNWNLREATGVNKDGSVVVGVGTDSSGNWQAWLARVSPFGSGIVNTNDLNRSLTDAGRGSTDAGLNLSDLSFNGAHHRTLRDSGLVHSANGACAWATADAARFNSNNSKMQLTEVGVCNDFDTTLLGLGVGQAWTQQGLDFGGSARYQGQYLIAEADQLFSPNVEGSITGYYGRFDSTINRNYQNGAVIDTSTGNPATISTAVRLRLDWLDIARLGQFNLSPYTAYTRSQTKIGAYTETGGGFPASYNASTPKSNDFRVGLAGRAALTDTSDLRLAAEAVHYQTTMSGPSGQIIGLSSFSVAGQAVRQNGMRVTTDLDHRLSNTSLVTVGLNAGKTGADPSWGVTLGYRTSF